ncbi:MAG: transposase [Chloroflexi bacterium]|uniref:Transposase n=2 Tax=Candidatus Chlorohelix allophototropha TaxID=3003348 RepID=A0A8T7M328_9CHLR|nr:transposase [Chloroflexota bacterium]WJW66015.1 transposase [Chloroflexota bacterium L227-S17]NWJ45949.1 transposase [Chloroflexota bacterium]NWJ46645.1 transposase [Chloroflexota bacterium]NWJ46791.1 transposase [Chloroflexota bacterium]
MNLNTLKEFRHEIYDCFEYASDALFNLADALMTESQAQSVLELTLSPNFERKWPSLYEALQMGQVNQTRFEQTMVRYAPHPFDGERLVLAVDATNIERPFSTTSADRGWLYKHNLPNCDKPVTVGWQFSTVVVVPAQTSSHTYIVSNRRIKTSQTPAEVASQQLSELRPYFAERPLNLGDRYYPTKAFIQNSSKDYDLLLRLKSNRVFYRKVVRDEQKRGRGAPAKHGARFQCNDPNTHGLPQRVWVGTDENGHKLVVSAWTELHLREAPELALSIIRIQREAASGKTHDPLESWYVWSGQTELDLTQVWSYYKRRYSIEHGYRFDKQDLLWEKPRLRYPSQFELWTAIVSLVHDELQIAQGLGLEVLRPWENSQRQPSPQQIRRGLSGIIVQLGSPAKASKVRGNGKGRAVGTKVRPATRYKVVKKGFSTSNLTNIRC